MSSVDLGDRGVVEYTVTGDGPPVVLIPGLGQRRSGWGEVALEIGPLYRVYSCDLRGYGGGNAPWQREFTMADLARDMRLFMDALGIGGAAVVGHSEGGFVALELALACPDRVESLVLAASASYTDEYGRTLLRHWRALAEEKSGPQLLIDDLFLWNFSPHFCNTRTREMKILKSLVRREDFPLKAFIQHTLACEGHDTRSRLPSLKTPTLLLGGASDIVMTLRHNVLLHELMPNSRIVTTPNVGHQLVAEAPEAVVPTILEHLAQWKT